MSKYLKDSKIQLFEDRIIIEPNSNKLAFVTKITSILTILL